MKIVPTIVALSFLLLLPVTTKAQHENQAYLPLTSRELSKKFAVTYVGTLGHGRPGYFEDISDKSLPTKLNIGPSGANVDMTNDDILIISGKDKRGRDWSVQPPVSAVDDACRFYEADLDRNGIHDAVLIFPTGGNGLAPTNHILTITFDEQGRPVTFEADGYFQESDGKIFDLVDLDRNGRADLIYMNFSDGYWITNIYEIRNARWRRISGRHGNRSYPLYTRFTIRENHKLTVPKRGRHPVAADFSNASPRLTGTLVSYQWDKVNSWNELSLRVKDKQGNIMIGKPETWRASFVVVLDSAEGRKILFFQTEDQSMKPVLDQIIAKRCEVALFGQSSAGELSPEIVWASVK